MNGGAENRNCKTAWRELRREQLFPRGRISSSRESWQEASTCATTFTKPSEMGLGTRGALLWAGGGSLTGPLPSSSVRSATWGPGDSLS